MIMLLIVCAALATSVIFAIQKKWAPATWFILLAIFLQNFLPSLEAGLK